MYVTLLLPDLFLLIEGSKEVVNYYLIGLGESMPMEMVLVYIL